MPTKAKLAEKVLLRLGRLGKGKNPDPVSSDQVKGAYDSLYQELLDDDKVTWSSEDDIPDAFVLPLVNILSYQLGGDFGISEIKLQRWYNDQLIAYRRINKLTANKYEPDTEAEYY